MALTVLLSCCQWVGLGRAFIIVNLLKPGVMTHWEGSGSVHADTLQPANPKKLA